MSRLSLSRLCAIAVAVSVLTLHSAAALAEERPFRASLAGNAHLSPTDVPWILRNDETGEGEATHLGHFSWADLEYADFSVIPGGVYVTATFTMTAANGDQLHGEFTSIGMFADPQTLVIHGSYEFAGGTGRFADATGSGDIDAVALLAPGLPFTGMLTGSIDY